MAYLLAEKGDGPAIAAREARETDHWLRLLDKSGFLSAFPKKEILFSENLAIVNILTKIVKTSTQADATS
jgi:hypothetical protein